MNIVSFCNKNESRAKWAISFVALIDLAAIAPFYVSWALHNVDARFTSAVRVLRLTRVLKAERHSRALALWWRVLATNASLLVTAMSHASVAAFVFASLLYYSGLLLSIF